jgi:hypothetical protein
VPMYNTFEDVFKFMQIFEKALQPKADEQGNQLQGGGAVEARL